MLHTNFHRASAALLLLTTALVFAAPAAAQKRTATPRIETYACPMDADVTSKSPGKCRKCGMKLVEVTAPPADEATKAAPPSASPSSNTGDAEARRKMAAASAKYFPSHVLVTQDGREVRFYDDLLKGKIVVINFMFTTCAGVCSPMTANLAKVRQYLGDRVGRDVVMLSISVDPSVDTPEVLKAYAAKHKAGPGWLFLTGRKENVEWVLYKLGGYTAEKTQHSSVLIIGNEATGEWMKTHAMMKPSSIAEAVIKMAAPAAK